MRSLFHLTPPAAAQGLTSAPQIPTGLQHHFTRTKRGWRNADIHLLSRDETSLRAFSMLQPLLKPPSLSTSSSPSSSLSKTTLAPMEVPRATARSCSSGASPRVIAPTCKVPAGLRENKPPRRGPATQARAGSVQYRLSPAGPLEPGEHWPTAHGMARPAAGG